MSSVSSSPGDNKSFRRPSSDLPKWTFAEALAELELKEAQQKSLAAAEDASTKTQENDTHNTHTPTPRPFFRTATCTITSCPLNERNIPHAPGPYQHHGCFWAGQLHAASARASRFRFCNPPPFVWASERLFDWTFEEMERFREEGRRGALVEVGKVNAVAADVVGRFLELHGGFGA